MSDIAVSRVGQINASGDADALFLKVFSGEVKTTFDQVNIFMGLQRTRDITSGKSAQFPVVGRATASYHTPGEEIDGQAIKENEKIILIDDLLISPVGIANIDEAKSHFDIRRPYSTELGRALARAFDSRAARTVILAARASATITGGNGGTLINAVGANTDAEVLKNAIISAAQKLDEKDVPDTDRHTALRPAQYSLLVQDTDVMNKDWGGSGSLATGQIATLNNVLLHKSNSVPNSVVAGVTGENNTYSGTFTNVVAPVWHTEAIGTVRLLGLAVETEYSVRHQSTLIVAKYALGTGILRPECAVEITNV